MKNNYKKFLVIGEKELESADFLQAMEPPPLEIIIYLTKTSVLTFLKSYMIAAGKEINNDNQIINIYEKCLSLDRSFQEIDPEMQTFLEIPIEIHHPLSENIDQSDMKIAIMSARRIYNFIKEKIGEL